MPKTCRTDTFRSGKLTFGTLLMAAVVNLRGTPETRSRMAEDGCWDEPAESNGRS